MDGLIDRFDAFIFDWDGTMQSLRTILMINEALKSIGRDTKSALEGGKRYRRNYSELNLKRLIEMEEIDNSVMSYLLDAVLWVSRPKLRNDVPETLKYLSSKGKKVIVFSNANRRRLLKEVKLLGISKYIDVIVSARDLRAPKPNPSGLNAAIRISGVRKSRCVYIGDMVTDIITARSAKIASCAIAGGFDRYDVLRKERPNYIYHSMEEFLRRGLGKRG